MDRLHDRKLREDSLKAFAKALHTDRMVAITGAMSTRGLGYPSWTEFVAAYARIARDLANEIAASRAHEKSPTRRPDGDPLKDIRDRADELESAANRDLDIRVPMWALHDCFVRLDRQMRHHRAGLVIDDEYQEPALQRFEQRIARIFLTRTYGRTAPEQAVVAAAIRPLISSLGIKRVATFNYDLELERAFMLRGDERAILKRHHDAAAKAAAGSIDPDWGKARIFAEKAKDAPEKMTSVQDFIGSRDTGRPIILSDRSRLTRTMGNGLKVESDIVDRERSDRLYEFAIGSAEIGRHVMHLHGRADRPPSMVANIRQYDRLYRLDDLHRDPFDHGLRVLFGGNPLLFVGIGMEEPELLQILQYFVSNLPIRRPAPAFLIWNTTHLPADQDKAIFMADKRLEFRTKLGIHLLFDEDIVQPGDRQWLDDLACHSPGPNGALAAQGVKMDEAIECLGQILKRIRTAPASLARKEWEAIQAWADTQIGSKVRDMQGMSATDPADGRKKLEAMTATLSRLPALVARVDQRVERRGATWRTIDARLSEQDENGGGPYRLYGSMQTRTLAAAILASTRLPVGALEAAHPSRIDRNLIVAIGSPGFGRGTLSEYLAQMEEADLVIGDALLRRTKRANRLVVNAGFSYDSDTMLVGIAAFLQRRCTKLADHGALRREECFTDASLLQTDDNALVIINGADRFFSLDGIPLSAELDHFLRCLRSLPGKVQVLLLGSERVRRYAKAIAVDAHRLPSTGRLVGGGRWTSLDDGDRGAVSEPEMENIDSAYFESIARKFARQAELARDRLARDRSDDPRLTQKQLDTAVSAANQVLKDRALQIDRETFPRAFYESYLSPQLLQALGLNCPTAFEILRTMCFIGGPVEAEILLYAPKVRAILAEQTDGDWPGTDRIADADLPGLLATTISQLHALGLLIALDPHEPAPSPTPASDVTGDCGLWQRYALHRSLTTFLRDRHGAPINDAKLATTFNMSLFMSEPSENYTPEPSFHDELGALVDSLIGGWHDIWRFSGKAAYPLPADPESAEYADALARLYLHQDDMGHAARTISRRSSRIASSCLRCALSLVRNYYSTGALLKLDRERPVVRADRDGALTEHAHRLDRMVTAFGDISVARDIASHMFATASAAEIDVGSPVTTGDGDSPGPDGIASSWAARRQAHMGPDPFYPDDLVWLHNERGVVALTQGHLFEAREAFSAALAVNATHVEGDYRGHNWRRISINQLGTRIERGALKPAERLLDRIEATIGTAPRGNGQADEGNHIETIRAMFRDNEDPPVHGDRHYTRESMLMVALTTGYRGLIAQMYGRDQMAAEKYRSAIGILERLNEQRGLAHFRRHYASLLGRKDDGEGQISDAITAARSAQQMDILHRARVVRADMRYRKSPDVRVRRKALQDIKEALRYAARADCYRVRIEASTSLARHMRESGDYDTALRYATDALTTACRYGHSLHKTLLRIEIAQILIARGDPRSGEALLEQAAQIASSKGYHLALERVQRAFTDHAASKPVPNRTDIAITE